MVSITYFLGYFGRSFSVPPKPSAATKGTTFAEVIAEETTGKKTEHELDNLPNYHTALLDFAPPVYRGARGL